MFDRFTDQAKRVLTRSREETLRRRDADIDVGPLLIALASVSEGIAATALRNTKVGPDDLRQEIDRIAGIGTAPLDRQNIAFSTAARRVFRRAMEQAELLGDRHVDTGQVLIAVLREDAGAAAAVLRNLRVEPDGLLRNVAEVRRTRESPEALTLYDPRQGRRVTLLRLLREENLPALSAEAVVPEAMLRGWRDGIVAALEAALRASRESLGG
jgi:ATP-dependent Clp protease ATP-binding subunit ClpA